MLKVTLYSLLLWSSLSTGEEVPRFVSSKCDHMGVNTLINMGLEPQFENNEECPSSWKWPEQIADTCIYNGKYYKQGEEFIKKDEYTESSCNCNVRKGNSIILCGKANYTSKYEKPDRSYTCESGNRKYQGNQRFQLENSFVSCKCKPGFKGDYIPPFCKRTSFDIINKYEKEVLKQCIPYYDNFKNIPKPALCNPSGFICNEKLLEISPINVIKNSTDSVTKMCKIDDESYSQGTVLNVTFASNSNKKNVNCTCATPPLFTCVNNYYPAERKRIMPMPMPRIMKNIM